MGIIGIMGIMGVMGAGSETSAPLRPEDAGFGWAGLGPPYEILDLMAKDYARAWGKSS